MEKLHDNDIKKINKILPLGTFIFPSHQKWKFMMSINEKYIQVNQQSYEVKESYAEQIDKIDDILYPTNYLWTKYFQDNMNNEDDIIKKIVNINNVDMKRIIDDLNFENDHLSTILQEKKC